MSENFNILNILYWLDYKIQILNVTIVYLYKNFFK